MYEKKGSYVLLMHSENKTLCWAEYDHFGIQNKTDLECVIYRIFSNLIRTQI